MQRYLVRRLFQIIPVFIGITFISFMIIRLAPGDPIVALFPPEVLNKVDRKVLAEQLGLNDPLPVQYLKMMANFFSGQLRSFQEKQTTFTLIADRLPTTLILSASAILCGLVIGIPIALISARRPYSILDTITTTGALIGVALPQFWLALVLILIFSEQLKLFPASGLRPIGSTSNNLVEMVPYLIMPVLVLTSSILPSIIRYTRSSLLDALGQDYVRTARSKGLRERRVIFAHALRNALIPVVTLIGSLLPLLLGGSVLVESIFGLPGLGRLAVRAALNRDYPVVLTLNMLSALLVLFANLLTDIVYTRLDPRISLG